MAATEKRPEIIALARDLQGVPMCEDYERMISGMMYNPTTPQLSEARHLCRGRTADYNNLDTKTVSYEEIGPARHALLSKLVGRVGPGTFVEPPFYVDYGCNTVIGENCFINWKLVPIYIFPPQLHSPNTLSPSNPYTP
ncbi:maltose acetyltransferase-domain-containing protein [Aspergillus taichungensis]|uniref:Maltose acetyltransferase-domain-containing protein n=1 Tax=Aspergillus taichungensis TaxID=482145 RepID=A0A2J5I3B2_9EURO|nr:maltose acetyltransferase-domain-containing protein [Aspergillus taichungensis]